MARPQPSESRRPGISGQTVAGEGPMNAKQTETGLQYDGDLQMFCDAARELRGGTGAAGPLISMPESEKG